MYRYLIIVPAMALIVGPRLWVEYVRRRHDSKEIADSKTGAELARELLDLNELPGVKVEQTDIGDHYDPRSKAVRLSRESFERRTLAALVTAAHEVGHALQDATDYPPFRWRSNLVRMARGTAEVGGVLLISTPVAALIARTPIPPTVIGATACAVLGSGLAAQLATLPTEWDASFRRAMPMLEARYLSGTQVDGAKEMLLACSLTYVASSLASVLQLWPWLPHGPVMLTPAAASVHASASTAAPSAKKPKGDRNGGRPTFGAPRRRTPSKVQRLVRLFGTPLIRTWYQAQGRRESSPNRQAIRRRTNQCQPGC